MKSASRRLVARTGPPKTRLNSSSSNRARHLQSSRPRKLGTKRRVADAVEAEEAARMYFAVVMFAWAL